MDFLEWAEYEWELGRAGLKQERRNHFSPGISPGWLECCNQIEKLQPEPLVHLDTKCNLLGRTYWSLNVAWRVNQLRSLAELW